MSVPVSYSVPGEKSSPRFAAAFAAGCGGLLSTDLTRLQPGSFAAFCTPPTWSLLQQAQGDQRDWYYGDHGYFCRSQYYRITRNAYQHDGRGQALPTRFRQCWLDFNPVWQTRGAAIIVCPNSPIYMRHFAGVDAEPWAATVVQTLQQYTDRPILVRWKTQVRQRPLQVDLPNAWAVVVFSSAAAVEALLAGVPVCTLAPWAATARMGITDLAQVESPYYPDDRELFLWNLAANQWTLDEIRQGIAWQALHAQETHRVPAA